MICTRCYIFLVLKLCIRHTGQRLQRDVKKTATGMPDIEDYWAAFGDEDTAQVSDSDSDAGMLFCYALRVPPMLY